MMILFSTSESNGMSYVGDAKNALVQLKKVPKLTIRVTTSEDEMMKSMDN